MTTALQSPPYGRDNSATDQIDRYRTATGPQLLAEAAYRRLVSTRGTLPDVANPGAAQNYGYPLAALLNKAVTQADIAAAESGAGGELEKDPRLASVEASFTRLGPGAYSAAFLLHPLDGTAPIPLAVSVQDLDITLLEADQ